MVLAFAVGASAPSPTSAASSPAAVASSQPAQASPGAAAGTTKWILVDLSLQRLTAYQGSKAVYSWPISSGVKKYPTLVGTFSVYAKLPRQRMVGGTGADHYDLPNVPNVMYFNAGDVIHGAYWHHNFGHPMSHGCINMPLAAAAWLFNWTPLGTTVIVQR